jgi:D-3-phosphoglycerate dehydrogenase
MPTVVIAYEGFGDIDIEQETLRAAGLHVIHTKALDTPESNRLTHTADALMVTIQPVPAALIDAMQQCKIISRVGTGLDAIDLQAATRRGIWVTNVPDYSIDEVSTHALALMLSHARRLPVLFEMVRQSGWYNAALDRPVQRLATQTLGVVGYGRIGAATARKGRGVGFRVIVHDPFVAPDQIEADGCVSVALEHLLREADYVSLHCPLTASTRHLINASTLALMKPTALLVNTSRGGLIDEMALLDAVRAGALAGAALDVLNVEPPAPDHPFLHEPRIVLTPHNAWYSEQAKQDVRRKGAEEVVRVLSGARPINPVNTVQ